MFAISPHLILIVVYNVDWSLSLLLYLIPHTLQFSRTFKTLLGPTSEKLLKNIFVYTITF